MALKNDEGKKICIKKSGLDEELLEDIMHFGEDCIILAFFEIREGVEALINYYYPEVTNEADIEINKEKEFCCTMTVKEACDYVFKQGSLWL